MIILVVGMHRSGTSMVARGLHAMGANLGVRLETAPHPYNPHGHWEHSDVWQAQERLLVSLGRPWQTDPRPLPDRWIERPESQKAITEFAAIAASEIAAHAQWLVKDPRSSLLIPLWRQVAGRVGCELRVLCIRRDVEQVVASLAARDAMPASLARLIWDQHQRSIDRDAEGLPVAEFDHGDIMQDPHAAFMAMASFCGLVEAPARSADAAALVEQSLWHHRASSAPAASGSAGPVAQPGARGDVSPDAPSPTALNRAAWRLQALAGRAARALSAFRRRLS